MRRGTLAGLAMTVGVGLMSSCTTAQDARPSTTVSITAPHKTSTTEVSLPVDPNPCGSKNPSYGPYNPANSVATQLGQLTSPGEDHIFFPTSSADQTTRLKAGLESAYGLSIEFSEHPGTVEIDGIETFTFSPAVHGNPDDDFLKQSMLEQTLDTLSLLPEEEIRDAKVKKIVFTGKLVVADGVGMEHNGEVVSEVGGAYVDSQDAIYITTGKQTRTTYTLVHRALFHEITHAIDRKVMCGEVDVDLDLSFSGGSHYAGWGRELNLSSPDDFRPGKDREFADAEGIESVNEDRATTAALTFYSRGIIQKGDPDYGSPFHTKQQEYLRRIEAMNPGITKYLIKRTADIRDSGFSELESD